MVVNRSDEAARTLIDSGERVAATFSATNEKLRTRRHRHRRAPCRPRTSFSTACSPALRQTSRRSKPISRNRSEEFAAAINQAVDPAPSSRRQNLSDQVARLGDVTREMLDGVSMVANRFEAQTNSLTEATRNFSEVNRQIETTVDERRPALESLTAGLRARSEELDGMMRSFTRIIAETLKTAEERATAVSRMLTENTSSATKGVIDNFETMNRTASTEGKKAADSVREANRQLVEEMGQAVSEAARRFTEATKRNAPGRPSELQRDLERDPRADQARRSRTAGGDQGERRRHAPRRLRPDIGAERTSEIITRHGKTLDLSSPALGEPSAQRSPPAESPSRLRPPSVPKRPPGLRAKRRRRHHAPPTGRGGAPRDERHARRETRRRRRPRRSEAPQPRSTPRARCSAAASKAAPAGEREGARLGFRSPPPRLAR